MEDKIIEWHKKTFPDATLTSQLMKLEEELREAIVARKHETTDKMLDELTDAYIVATSLVGRFDSAVGAFFLMFVKAHPIPGLKERVDKKMEINAKRKWVFKNGVYRHGDK